MAGFVWNLSLLFPFELGSVWRKLECTAWLVFLLLSFGCLGYLTRSMITEFAEQKINVRTTTRKADSLPLPAMVVCRLDGWNQQNHPRAIQTRSDFVECLNGAPFKVAPMKVKDNSFEQFLPSDTIQPFEHVNIDGCFAFEHSVAQKQLGEGVGAIIFAKKSANLYRFYKFDPAELLIDVIKSDMKWWVSNKFESFSLGNLYRVKLEQHKYERLPTSSNSSCVTPEDAPSTILKGRYSKDKCMISCRLTYSYSKM